MTTMNTELPVAAKVKPSRSRKRATSLKWFLFVLPALAVYLVIFLLPSMSAAYYSFTDWNGLKASFIGLDNFKAILHNDDIKVAFKNTLFYAVFIVIFQNIFSLLLAVALDKKLKTVNVLRTLFFMPILFSPLIIGYVWGYMLEPNFGVVNTLFSKLGMDFLVLDWLGNPKIAVWMIVLVTVWQNTGYNMVIYLAGLQAIPGDMYEAAEIDGAGAWKRFTNVTLPLIAPAMTINILITMIGSLKLFDTIFAMTKGGPGYTTQSFATMIYTVGFGSGSQWGFGAAMSVVLFLFIFVVTIFLVRYLRGREIEL